MRRAENLVNTITGKSAKENLRPVCAICGGRVQADTARSGDLGRAQRRNELDGVHLCRCRGIRHGVLAGTYQLHVDVNYNTLKKLGKVSTPLTPSDLLLCPPRNVA